MGYSSPTERGTAAPTFEIYRRRLCLRPYNPQSMSIVAKRLDGSRSNLAGGRPLPWPHCYMGTQPPSPKGALLAPNFRPMPVVAIRLDGSRWHLAGGRPRPRPHCVRWGRSSPSPKGVQPPIFGPCLLWLNGRPSQLLLSTCPTNLGPTGCYCRCLRDRRSVSQRRYGGASISRPEGGRSFHYNLFI